jgi:hypothetical protein
MDENRKPVYGTVSAGIDQAIDRLAELTPPKK